MIEQLRQSLFVRNRLTMDRFTPIKMTINITGLCNLRCKFCEKSRYKNNNEIEVDALLNLLSWAKSCHAGVILSGGEPFMHSRIWDVLSRCIEMDKKVSIITNGTLLSELTNKQQQILNKSISIMSLSVDSPFPDENDRVKGVSGTLVNALGYLRNERREHLIGINTVMDVDFKNVLPMIDFAGSQSVPVNFKPLIFESCFPGLPKIDSKVELKSKMGFLADKWEELKKLENYANKKRVATNLSLTLFYIKEYYKNAGTNKLFYDDIFKHFMCFIPLTNLTVNENGEIMKCLFLPGKANIYNGGLNDSWLSEALEFRNIWKNGQRFAACKSCPNYFAENMRYNLFAQPISNLKYAGWFFKYYLGRVMQNEGRVR